MQFDGTLGLWKGDPYKIELRGGAQPHHAKPYGLLQAYEQTFKQEVERLWDVGELRKINRSGWVEPIFQYQRKIKPLDLSWISANSTNR